MFKERIGACMVLYAPCLLIYYATWPCPEKVEFWPIDRYPRVGGGELRTNSCYHVAAIVIPFNLICNMTMLWKSWSFTYWPHLQGRRCVCVGGGGGVLRAKYLLPCCCIPDSLRHETWPCFEKKWILTPRVEGGLRAKNLLPCCCIRNSL